MTLGVFVVSGGHTLFFLFFFPRSLFQSFTPTTYANVEWEKGRGKGGRKEKKGREVGGGNKALTKVRPVRRLLQTLVDALDAEHELLLAGLDQLPRDEEAQQRRQRLGEAPRRAQHRAGLEDVEDGLQPPVPLGVLQAVEGLAEGQVSDDVWLFGSDVSSVSGVSLCWDGCIREGGGDGWMDGWMYMKRHTERGEVVPSSQVHHGTTTPILRRAAAAAAAQAVQLVDEQGGVAPDDRLLGAEGLVAEGRVLQAAHAAVAGVIGVEDVDDARDGLVPPLRVLLEVARALLVGEAVDGRPGPAIRVCLSAGVSILREWRWGPRGGGETVRLF